MKVLHINTYDRGGAANACIRLHLSLLDCGIDSHILFLQEFENKNIPNSLVFPKIAPKTKNLLNRLCTKLFSFWKKYWNNNETTKNEIRNLIPETVDWFSFPDTDIDITEHPSYKDADIINLHWVSDFLDYSFFKKNNKPVVWTLHDMNAFTGGCHYSFSCNGFEESCMECPQLKTIKANNFSSAILNYKEKYLTLEDRTSIISPSEWMGKQIKKSKILKNKQLEIIPYGLNCKIFKPYEKDNVRKALGLPLDKKILLFVSPSLLNNKRKGFSYLTESLNHLKEFRKDTVLCVVGSNGVLRQDDFQIYENPIVSDENLMSQYYSACDLFVLPSIEDNLPNTVIESLMCGTPVIGFNIGGMPDMIQDGINGYLSEDVNVNSLALSIRKFLLDPDMFERNKIRELAIEKYNSSIQAQSYISHYKKRIQ